MVNDLTCFKNHREVEHRDAAQATQWASMRKTSYRLPAPREIPETANRRHLEFLSAIEDPRNGRDKLDKLSQPVRKEGRSQPGCNLFDADEEALFAAIAGAESNIRGRQNKALRRLLPDNNSGQISRLLRRLRVHGLIQKAGHTCKCYRTRFGKAVIRVTPLLCPFRAGHKRRGTKGPRNPAAARVPVTARLADDCRKKGLDPEQERRREFVQFVKRYLGPAAPR